MEEWDPALMPEGSFGSDSHFSLLILPSVLQIFIGKISKLVKYPKSQPCLLEGSLSFTVALNIYSDRLGFQGVMALQPGLWEYCFLFLFLFVF